MKVYYTVGGCWSFYTRSLGRLDYIGITSDFRVNFLGFRLVRSKR